MRGLFDPSKYRTFRFTERSLSADGAVRLAYALDDEHEFVEEFDVPVAPGADLAAAEPILDLLHWVAGVSYYKTAAPPEVACETGAPGPAAASFLEALYSEGLGEFAVVNQLGKLPRPRFPRDGAKAAGDPVRHVPARVLVPVGGGKDSIVALEIVRRSGLDFTLFSVRDDPAMQRTAAVAEMERLVAQRRLPLTQLGELNRSGALNGHVPITAIVSCVALLTAALNGYDTVTLANERSASAGNVVYDGVEVNHQFSKSARAEALLRGAIAETGAPVDLFSLLRPASELGIARTFAGLPQYHAAFTSCNAIFRLDPELRLSSWCGNCPKCRFVFLVLAPFMEPAAMEAIFGTAMLDDLDQYEGFALLTATGGHKPFECVGEEEESLAAISLLAADPRWRTRPVVAKLVAEVLAARGDDSARVSSALSLSDAHNVPAELIDHVHALLRA